MQSLFLQTNLTTNILALLDLFLVFCSFVVACLSFFSSLYAIESVGS